MLWIANILILIGLWLVGYKWRHAFLFSIAGEALYSWMSYKTGQTELCFICVVFCVLAFRNWWKWGNDDSNIRNGSDGPRDGHSESGVGHPGPRLPGGDAELSLPGSEGVRRGVCW